ncbi:hypothetical protein CARUB_v10015660mg [Capsella rubella]|uniref:Uncharacterized protein n=1 Tax=Capsella rubella TaxID=81985 RepID=R0HVY5_9BRAS|nr:hypothetical protein CARUB_v10015660mg [Capsella rubella]
MDRAWRREMMRPPMMRPQMTTRDFLAEMEYASSSIAMPMDVDDDDDNYGPMPMDLKPLPWGLQDTKFFNSFEDDFDDSDIN